MFALSKEFRAGNYGLKVLADPILRYFNGSPKLGTMSGKPLLADGKQKLCALNDLLEDLASLKGGFGQRWGGTTQG